MAVKPLREKNSKFPLKKNGGIIDNPHGEIGGNAPTVDFAQPSEVLAGDGPIDGSLSIYDPENPDRRLFDDVEQEIIAISSPPIKYYSLSIKKSKTDDLYGEIPQRIYDNPVTIFGSYENPEPTQDLGKFGLSSPEEIEIVFNLNYLLKSLNGHIIKTGDAFRTYDNKIWEALSTIEKSEPGWRVMHVVIKCKRFNGDSSVFPDEKNVQDSSIKPLQTSYGRDFYDP